MSEVIGNPVGLPIHFEKDSDTMAIPKILSDTFGIDGIANRVPYAAEKFTSPGDKKIETFPRRIISEDQTCNLSRVEKLSNLCVTEIVNNFESKSGSKVENPGNLLILPLKYRAAVINKLSINIPLKIAGPAIPDEGYWKRKSIAKYKLSQVRNPNESWKQLFFELYLQGLLESFPSVPNSKELVEECIELGSTLIEKLQIRQNCSSDISQPYAQTPDHQDLGLILTKLVNLKELWLECSKTSFSNGLSLKNGVSLSNALNTLGLKKLTIQASGINDELCRVICKCLINHKSLQYFDISHNKIGDSGARGIAKFLASSQHIEILKLTNNQVGTEGAKAIAQSLRINSTLNMLHMRLNRFLDAGGAMILIGCQKSLSLMSLDIAGNDLGPASQSQLLSILKNNSAQLTSIDLSCNKLNDGRAIFDALSLNKHLDLRHNLILQDQLNAIQKVVEENKND